MTELHSALLIAVIALVTMALRFVPFLIFGGKRKTPKYISYLGRVLPFAIMGMLVVYCLRGTGFSALSEWLPQLISCALVVILHLWKKNTLVSIIGGTVCYMVLVQLVF